MSKAILVFAYVVLATTAADPLLFSAPLVASPYPAYSPYSPYSAAYINQPLVSPVGSAVPTAVPALPAYPTAAVPAYPTAAVPAAVPAGVPAAVPYSSVSAYSYGSSYSIQDYLPAVVNANPSVAYSAYSLPYAYAADYFYRR